MGVGESVRFCYTTILSLHRALARLAGYYALGRTEEAVRAYPELLPRALPLDDLD